MSYQVLARKWRPQVFSEVYAQEHITTTLQNAIKHKKLAQAYLLTGTRGVGKTTVARIFAKALRCEAPVDFEPCLKCTSCVEIHDGSAIDYIEIDGASNNSVEAIRGLIENVQYLPSYGKYKVYVIDEVHMLTVNAFNALLKTLEEPPEHIIFVFATTDPQKLIGTVLSRCQRLDFRTVTEKELTSYLEKILVKENITFSPPSLIRKIAQRADGSIRDSLSLLDQVKSFAGDLEISEESLNTAMGIVSEKIVIDIISSIFNKDKERLLSVFEDVSAGSLNLDFLSNQILESFFELIRNESQSDMSAKIDGIEKIAYVELLWIYENLSKDLEWALKSITPYNSVLFCLVKTTQRDLILNADGKKLEKKKIIKKEVSWDNFLEHLFSENKSLAVNLERGNILNKENKNLEAACVEVGLDVENKIFYDFLNESVNYRQLNKLLSNYCEKEMEIRFTLLESENNFESAAEVKERVLLEKKKLAEENFVKNKFLIQAEEIFNTKIEKVVVKENSQG